jgi:hypothetical protein
MTERQREEWTRAMRHHQRELERLGQTLGSIGLRTPLASEVFVNAQMIRHQISVALLASRLEAPVEA